MKVSEYLKKNSIDLHDLPDIEIKEIKSLWEAARIEGYQEGYGKSEQEHQAEFRRTNLVLKGGREIVILFPLNLLDKDEFDLMLKWLDLLKTSFLEKTREDNNSND
jgi:hypothetical protein